MSRLSAFLNPEVREQTKEIVISDRFRDENGNPATVKIRSLSQSENEKLIASATRRIKKHGVEEDYFDKILYNKRLVLESVVEPDLRSEELCRAYGVLDPLDVAGRMFWIGEHNKLLAEIAKISNISLDLEAEEAKN